MGPRLISMIANIICIRAIALDKDDASPLSALLQGAETELREIVKDVITEYQDTIL